MDGSIRVGYLDLLVTVQPVVGGAEVCFPTQPRLACAIGQEVLFLEADGPGERQRARSDEQDMIGSFENFQRDLGRVADILKGRPRKVELLDGLSDLQDQLIVDVVRPVWAAAVAGDEHVALAGASPLFGVAYNSLQTCFSTFQLHHLALRFFDIPFRSGVAVGKLLDASVGLFRQT